VLILPYPNNPTGGIMERDDLAALIPVIEKHNLMVVSDEIYCELIYGGREHVSFASLPGMLPRTITVNGFSKAFAMTGWRVGYVCGPAELISVMNKIHQYGIMCAPRMGQVAAEEALRMGRENGYEDILTMRESYDRRRRLMVESFRAMGLHCFEPYGAFYVFPSIRSTGLSSEDASALLLEKAHVLTLPGNAFGDCGEGFLRIACTVSVERLGEAFDRIAAVPELQ
jgi:aminotransferase